MGSCSSSSPLDLGSSQSHSSSARPLYLARPQPHTLFAPNSSSPALFPVSPQPWELVFLPRPNFPLQTPIPACSCSPPRPFPWSAGGLLFPHGWVWKGGSWGKTLDMKRTSRPAESVWDLGGSGLPGKRSPRDSRQLGMESSLGSWEAGGGAHEPILSSMEMSGWILDSQGIWEIALVDLRDP